MKTILKTVLVVMLVAGCVNAADYTTYEELKKLVETKTAGDDYILVDVRTGAEYADGYIPGAVNIPYTEITEGLAGTDHSKLIIVYCRSGNRSGQAKAALEEAGYVNVVDFGAVSNWHGPLLKLN